MSKNKNSFFVFFEMFKSVVFLKLLLALLVFAIVVVCVLFA